MISHYNVLARVNTIDLYLNYSCGLRCNHCFIGELLETNQEIPFNLAKSIIERSSESGVKCITLLGGEPTLYKQIIPLISLIIEYKIGVRIVTNGQKSFINLIKKLPLELLNKLHVCFSIDGSNKITQDKIRGKGTFLNLDKSIKIAEENNISMSAITSVTKNNYHDVLSIIEFSSINKMKYINIHYVTDRGFALKSNLVSITDWIKLCDSITNISPKIPVRLEKTFVSNANMVNCEVQKKENIIIDPNGRIFGCTMFMNFKNHESAIWSINGIKTNKNLINENTICKCNSNGCPAIKIVNNELSITAQNYNLIVDCIFNKTII